MSALVYRVLDGAVLLFSVDNLVVLEMLAGAVSLLSAKFSDDSSLLVSVPVVLLVDVRSLVGLFVVSKAVVLLSGIAPLSVAPLFNAERLVELEAVVLLVSAVTSSGAVLVDVGSFAELAAACSDSCS